MMHTTLHINKSLLRWEKERVKKKIVGISLKLNWNKLKLVYERAKIETQLTN
jgi:hypothetical protein